MSTLSFHLSDDNGRTFRQVASGLSAADVTAQQARIRTEHAPLLVITQDVPGAVTAWRRAPGGPAWMWRTEP